MITDIIYKVYRLEKRLKELEKNNTLTMREDFGTIPRGEGITVNNTVYSQHAKQAMLILAPANIFLQVFLSDKNYQAKGMVCIPLERGENRIEVTCFAFEQDVNCVLVTKIINLG